MNASDMAYPKQYKPNYAIAAVAALPALSMPLLPLRAPGRASVYLAKARARAFLQLIFWLPTNESTVTAMARSMSWAEQ